MGSNGKKDYSTVGPFRRKTNTIVRDLLRVSASPSKILFLENSLKS